MSIPDKAYKDNLDLIDFKVPEGTKYLGQYAFSGCENLRSITIPDSVTKIGAGAFGGCRSLQSVVIPKNVKSLTDHLFSNCYQLKSVVLPQGLRSIGICTFSKCFELDNVVIPSSVKRIGEFAFDKCDRLQHINLPSDVEIAENAFGVEPLDNRFNESIRSIIHESKLKFLTKDYLLNCKKRKKYYSVYLFPEQIGEKDPAVLFYAFSDAEVVELQHFLDKEGFNSHHVDLYKAQKLEGKNKQLDGILNDFNEPDLNFDIMAPELDLDHYCYLYGMTCLKYDTDCKSPRPVPFSIPLTDNEYLYLLLQLQKDKSYNYNDLLLDYPKLGKKLTEWMNNTYEEQSLEYHFPFVILFDEAEEDVKTIESRQR